MLKCGAITYDIADSRCVEYAEQVERQLRKLESPDTTIPLALAELKHCLSCLENAINLRLSDNIKTEYATKLGALAVQLLSAMEILG